MNKPISISCKCITYSRVEYIVEAIESFLRQEYDGESELVIVNDYPLQKLIFDHPKVRIINLDYTFPTIGAKENFAVENCKYDTIAVWDDDDMALPNHLSNINKFFPGYDLLHWNNGIKLVANKIEGLGNLGNSGIVYSKQIWKKVSKHPLENAGYDMSFVIAIERAGGKVARVVPLDEEVSWIYTWGGGSYHMSGLGTDTPDRDNVIKRHSEYIELRRKLGEIPTGDIYLVPEWKQDYTLMLKNYLTPLTTPMKILSATYGGTDVLGIVRTYVAKNRKSIPASNVLFGDTNPGVEKLLKIEYEINDVPYSKIVREGHLLELEVVVQPEVVYTKNENSQIVYTNNKKIKFIVPFIDKSYYVWQILLQINNFRKFGYEQDTVFLGTTFSDKISPELQKILDSPDVKAKFVLYPEDRLIRRYPASLKPRSMAKYFRDFPEEKETVYVYLDPDVIFLRPIDFDKYAKDDIWYEGNTTSYLNSRYIKSKGEQLFLEMCMIVGIDPQVVMANDENCGGAQFIIKNNTYELWYEIELLSVNLYKHMEATKDKYCPPGQQWPIQSWSAEMWTTDWCAWKYGIETKVIPELNFHMADHALSRLEYPFLHCTGNIEEGKAFNKKTYQDSPFKVELPDYADSITSLYVKEIREVKVNFPDLIW